MNSAKSVQVASMAESIPQKASYKLATIADFEIQRWVILGR